MLGLKQIYADGPWNVSRDIQLELRGKFQVWRSSIGKAAMPLALQGGIAEADSPEIDNHDICACYIPRD